MSRPSTTPTFETASLAGTTSLFSAGFVRLLLVQFLFGLSYSTFLLLPKFLRVELHASATEIGRVSGAATIVAAVVAPFVGTFARRWSRRSVLLCALVAEAIGAFGFCVAEEVGPFIYALRGFQGAAWVLVFNVTATWAADLVPERRMAQAIGYLGSAMLITNAVAPGVAEPLAMRFGYVPVFLGAGVVVALSLLSLRGLVDSTPSNATVASGAEVMKILRSPPVLAVFYGSLLLGAGIGAMFTYVQPYALERGAKVVGTFFFGYVAAAIFVRIGLSGLADRVGPARVAQLAFVLYSLTVGSTAFLRPDLLIFYGVGLGVSHGFGYPALTATGFSAVHRGQRSQFMSWYTFAFNLGFALTVLSLGPVVDAYGFDALFLTVGLVIASGVPWLAATHRVRPVVARG